MAWLLDGGTSQVPAGCGTVDGRTDLRGLAFPTPSGSPSLAGYSHGSTIKIHGARWSSLDLRGASLEHVRFHEADIRDCDFGGARLADLRLWRSSVEDCSFAGADLRQAVIGTRLEGRGNMWRRVSFQGADLRYSVMSGSTLDKCTLAGARLSGVSFVQMTLRDCVFTGRLERVVFDGRSYHEVPAPGPLTRVDFRGAEFRDVDFRGCRVEDVQWPEGQLVRVVPCFPGVTRRMVTLLDGDTSRNARTLLAVLGLHIKAPGLEDSVGVYVWEEYVAMGGLDFAEFVWATLDAAEGSSQR